MAEIKLNQIILADCMDIMRDIPDKYFELAIVDPPYGIDKAFTAGSRIARYGDPKKGNDNKPTPLYFKELFRVSQNQIVWGYNHLSDMLPTTKEFVFWYKRNPVISYSDGELAWTSFTRTARCFDYMYYGSHGADDLRIHAQQKPVVLYRWLLQNYAKPGDKIIDTHSGSGSCAIACHIEKRDFLAIEKDPDYHAASVKRLEEVRAQGVLF